MTEIPTWLEELVEEVVGEHSQAEPGWCSQRWQSVRVVRGQLEDEAEITRIEAARRGSPVRVVEDDLLDDFVGLLVQKIEGLLAVDQGLDRADEIQQEQVMTDGEAADIRRVLGGSRVERACGVHCFDKTIPGDCPYCRKAREVNDG